MGIGMDLHVTARTGDMMDAVIWGGIMAADMAEEIGAGAGAGEATAMGVGLESADGIITDIVGAGVEGWLERIRWEERGNRRENGLVEEQQTVAWTIGARVTA